MMNIRDFFKPQVWLPALLGVLIGLVLCIVGKNDDAPGLVLIGFIAATVLVFYGIYNAAEGATKGRIPAILCLLLSAFGVIWTIVLAIEGEFGDSPGIIIFAGLICIVLLIIGIRLLNNNHGR